jgi:phosphoserine phosphatase
MWSAAVTQLLETVTREHAGAPVVFDADGTLWRGDVGEDFLRFAIARGLLPGSYAHYEALLAQSPAKAYGWCVEIMAGLEEAELQAACDAFFHERYRGRIFPFVRPMLAQLTAAGCTPWICSASPRWAVLPGAKALGIESRHVIGVTCALDGSRLSGVVDQPVPVGPGKVTWLERRGVAPALGVGNGDFDLDMLAFSRRALVISPPDSSNQLVREARARGWAILSA